MLAGSALTVLPIFYIGTSAFILISNFVGQSKGSRTFYLGPHITTLSGRTITGAELILMGLIGAVLIFLGAKQTRKPVKQRVHG